MNVKEMLTEQLKTLGRIQDMAIGSGQLQVAGDISQNIMDYIRAIDEIDDDELDNYICPDSFD